jgi:glutathione S-transferase
MGPLRLYDYSPSANCYKVRLLLSQLGRTYERIPVDIFGGDTLTERYVAINPHRTTPVLELETGETIVDSAAILIFLAQGTSLLPNQRASLAQVLRWLVFEQTDVIPAIGGLRFRLKTGRLRHEDQDAIARKTAGEGVLGLLDSHLSKSRYFLEDRYSVADIAMFGYLHVAEEAGYDISCYPALESWLARVTEQPGYIEDLSPYPPNARPGAGRSIYDE